MKTYSVGLVGEAKYQREIRRRREGERVFVVHEWDNPHDDLALAVKTAGGETIGYVARSSWLRRAIHEEGQGCDARIKSIGLGETRMFGVVLEVMLTYEEIGTADFDRLPELPAAMPPATPDAPRRGLIARLLGL